MDDQDLKHVYRQLKGEIDSIMDKEGVDFVTMSKIIHQLVNDFDQVRKHRYP